MKCKYQFPASGYLRFPTGIVLEVGGRTYEIGITKERISYLSVTVSDFPLEYLPTIQPLRNQLAKASINIPDDPFRNDIIADIRAIEGGLSFWGLEEINVEALTVEWIPESE